MKQRRGLAPVPMSAKEAKASKYQYYYSSHGMLRYCSTAMRVESESGQREAARLANSPTHRRLAAEAEAEAAARMIEEGQRLLADARIRIEEAKRGEREAEEALRRLVHEHKSRA